MYTFAIEKYLEVEKKKSQKSWKRAKKKTQKKTMDMESFHINFFRSFISYDHGVIWLTHKTEKKKKHVHDRIP